MKEKKVSIQKWPSNNIKMNQGTMKNEYLLISSNTRKVESHPYLYHAYIIHSRPLFSTFLVEPI